MKKTILLLMSVWLPLLHQPCWAEQESMIAAGQDPGSNAFDFDSISVSLERLQGTYRPPPLPMFPFATGQIGVKADFTGSLQQIVAEFDFVVALGLQLTIPHPFTGPTVVFKRDAVEPPWWGDVIELVDLRYQISPPVISGSFMSIGADSLGVGPHIGISAELTGRVPLATCTVEYTKILDNPISC